MLLEEQEEETMAGVLPGEGEDGLGQKSLVGNGGQSSGKSKLGEGTEHGVDLPAEEAAQESARSSATGLSVPDETAEEKEKFSSAPSDDDISVSAAAVIFVVSAALIVIVNWQGKGRRRRR